MKVQRASYKPAVCIMTKVFGTKGPLFKLWFALLFYIEQSVDRNRQKLKAIVLKDLIVSGAT